MAGFRVDVFKGIRPSVNPRLLPPGEGQTAENARLGSGSLEQWKGPTVVEETAQTQTATIFRQRNNGDPVWLQWQEDVDVARGPVPDDALERIYFASDEFADGPRMTYLGIVETVQDYRTLGIPAPTGAPTLTGEALPEDAITGAMTLGSWATNYLKADFVIEDNLPASMNYWQMSDGSGYDAPGVLREYAIDFYVGQEIRIASVVDANTVTLESASGQLYLAKTEEQARSTGGILHFRTDDSGTTRDGYFRFYIPNGIEVTMTAHGLEAGDVIRVASIGATVTLVLEQFLGAGTLYGAESDNAAGTAGSNTWPSAPISVAADDFWIAGARAYPFVDVWVAADGAASASNFTIEGGFSWEIIERDGEPYTDLATNIESRAYVYTFVSNLGEEGPPSPPSDVVTIPLAGDVDVDDFDAFPTVAADGIQVEAIRIYRTSTGSNVTEFQFVAEITDPNVPYTDSIPDTELGEVLQTEEWDPPPEELVGLKALPNGGMAGFFGKTVCFCEPYYPHAWPASYRIAVDHDIVGLGILPNGVAILTTGPAYIAAGDHPRAMSLRHFTDSQACSSKRSIANTIDSVLYSSPDGLASIGSRGFALLTEKHARKREWQASFNPTSIHGFWHDQRYFGFFVGFGLEGGFVFDPANADVGLTTLTQGISCGYLDAEEDDLYIIPTQELTPMIVAGADTGTNTSRAMSSATATGAWTTRTTPAGSGDQYWRAGVFIEQIPRFFMFGEGTGLGDIQMISSDDGVTWTTRSPDLGNVVYALAYAPPPNFGTDGRLLAAGSKGGEVCFSYSDDGGIVWSTGQSWDTSSTCVACAWIGDRFIALDSSGNIHTSPTGLGVSAGDNTWSLVSAGAVSGSANKAKFVYLESLDRVLFMGDEIWYSDDKGVTWTAVGSTVDPQDMCYSPDLDKIVVVEAAAPYIQVSTDGGLTFTTETPAENNQFAGATWSPGLGLFIAVSRDGTNRVQTSAGNGTWEASAAAAAVEWEAVVAGGTAAIQDISIWDDDEASPLTSTHKSGRTLCPYPLNLGAARVVAEEYPVTFKLYNDRGTLVTTRSVTSDEVFRLPGGYLTSWFEIEIVATKKVEMVAVAETAHELMQG